MSLLVSVITPVYNTEKYLERCIDSILKQSYSNFELLLIDDGSTDASGKICDQYAATDSRIKVFHKRNGGVSSARNIGLRNVKGEWVTFIDSDDWIHPLYLEKLLGAVKNGVDFIISNCNVDITEEYSCKLIDRMNYSLIFFEDVSCYTVPWGKLYKANIIHENNSRLFNRKYESFFIELRLYKYSSIIYTLSVLTIRIVSFIKKNASFAKRFSLLDKGK